MPLLLSLLTHYSLRIKKELICNLPPVHILHRVTNMVNKNLITPNKTNALYHD